MIANFSFVTSTNLRSGGFFFYGKKKATEREKSEYIREGEYDRRLRLNGQMQLNGRITEIPQRTEILTQRSNLTGQRAKNTVNDLLVVAKSLSTYSRLASQFTHIGVWAGQGGGGGGRGVAANWANFFKRVL